MKIKFLPQNIEVEGSPDKSLLQIATENQLEIRSICKGVPSCAECRVRIKDGDNNVLPPGKAELSLIGTSYFIDGRRLSCQVRCYGDVTVDLTEQVERAENQVKKIRGFRTNKQTESKAVNDTMLLDAKPDESVAVQSVSADVAADKVEGAEKPQQQAKQQHHNQQKQHHQNQQRQGGGHGQNQGQNPNRQQGHQPKQQNQQQNQNRQKQGGGQQQNQQKQQQQAKQQQAKQQQHSNQQQGQQKQKQGGGPQNQNQNRQQGNQPKQQNQQQARQNNPLQGQQAKPQNPQGQQQNQRPSNQQNQNQNKPKQ
ncbi:(2Fe-2S)-binding protein [Bdellovibrio sp. SKB1291214]|uniref:2Fe-2S iron-sulfur cluster-binding protein n=1 Tax=Bdellovibrio sp. SKB1291214 TaxID=1732569 RepID=UPI000B515ED6|nr:2Fe-2S iron-sulfur cluster-binding protein [Bdellovibrio sp. SKB1291214]UYL09647.1 (2Fe-2S)-binding protein [Bdellovibrio sp. SKB1291214]